MLYFSRCSPAFTVSGKILVIVIARQGNVENRGKTNYNKTPFIYSQCGINSINGITERPLLVFAIFLRLRADGDRNPIGD